MVSQPVQCTHYAGPLRHRKEHLSELPAYNHPELLVGVELPPALKELLRLYVLLVKKLPETQAADLLQELNREGFELTQATLSRDLKQLKVAKAASMNGKYVYVLPNNIMYKRSTDQSAGEMLRSNGFISLQFSGNIAVIRTRPGYASSMAYDIDNNEFSEILGTIAGDDTIMLVLREGVATSKIRQLLSLIIPNIE